MYRTVRRLTCAVIATAGAAGAVAAQPPQPLLDTAAKMARIKTEQDLESIAVIDRRLMIPMRDGVRLMTDVYRPKNATDKVPTIFVRTPYNFNYWDVRNRVPGNMTSIVAAIKHGYAYVEQNERGRYFSEGTYDILGSPTDGYDMIKWLSEQPWSNGKVGLIGCSSTAEWQLGVAATAPPGLATIIPQGFGAGVGRVKPYYEQGNWYRGGAVQMLFASWLYDYVQNAIRPMFPPGTSQADLTLESRYFDLAAQAPLQNWREVFKHLPEEDMLKSIGGAPGIFADSEPIPTGGRMIQRTPNDPAWYRGGLYQDDMVIDVPGLYLMSWYDISVSPQLALFNHVRQTASPGIRDQQYAMIAPTGHCGYARATEHTSSSWPAGPLAADQRDEGDARWDYDALTYGWFDHFLKGEHTALLDSMPHVRYYTMGINKWQSSDTWPPKGAQPLTYFLASAGHANTAAGDGALTTQSPGSDKPDGFIYDPMNPVPTYGDGFCCMPGVPDGARDQREMEVRSDILVYTTPALKEATDVSGPITLTVYVSSDRKDTDFTVKLEDVYPDGRAYNLDNTIQRVRYREGYDKPAVWMESGKVYKVTMQPMNTSNVFEAGHRIRLQISSSDFPRFDRNLNTGGNNYDESTGLVAHNEVHHSREYPSSVTLTVVPHKPGELATEGAGR
jgi:uncharacterized protein